MNIATAVVPQAPSSTASSAPARAATGDDDSGADAVADPDANPAARFGRMLAQRLDAKGAADDTATDDPTVAAPARRAVTSKDDDHDPTRGAAASDDDAKDRGDLAAQLALVSQWAALPSAQDKASTLPNGDRRLDLRDKLDTVRGSASRRDDVDATNASKFASSRIVDLAMKNDAERGGKGERQPAVDAFLVRPEAVASTAAADAASLLSALGGTVSPSVVEARPSPAIAPAPTTALHEPVGSSAWAHEVGQATLRMAADDLQSASLRLNPEHLGPVDVQVRIDHGVAHLAFNAAHAETRQALEASRATLDQLFADQGLKVGDCAVGDASRRPFDDDAARQRTPTGRAFVAGDDSDAPATTTVRLRALGLVDTFA